MSSLAEKLLAIHGALDATDIPHAFGGALALAWCTQRARATIDIDINIFIPSDEAEDALQSLPDEVQWTPADVEVVLRDGQVRVWWDITPIDVFTNTTEFHETVAANIVWHEFVGVSVPFLSCTDLGVFKAFSNRTKDFADIEEMIADGTMDGDRVIGSLVRYLGAIDDRIERLRSLLPPAVST